MDRLTYRDDKGRAKLTKYGMRMYCSTQATADCFAHLEEIVERTMPKWISVKERLPERPDNWPHCAIRRCYFLVALESGCVESLGFNFGEMRWHSTGSPVTHWMPLPEPPKEGGGEDG